MVSLIKTTIISLIQSVAVKITLHFHLQLNIKLIISLHNNLIKKLLYNLQINVFQDNSVRLWKINPVLKQVSCLAIGHGHTSAVGAIAMSRFVND